MIKGKDPTIYIVDDLGNEHDLTTGVVRPNPIITESEIDPGLQIPPIHDAVNFSCDWKEDDVHLLELLEVPWAGQEMQFEDGSHWFSKRYQCEVEIGQIKDATIEHMSVTFYGIPGTFKDLTNSRWYARLARFIHKHFVDRGRIEGRE